jgi:hypothetical protein
MTAPQVRIREVTGTVRVMDGESLLTPSVMERIVAAVMQAIDGEHRDRDRRRRDTRIGGSCCDGCEGKEA